MEVQIHSDLHIEELDNIYKIKPKYDTLILAGDYKHRRYQMF